MKQTLQTIQLADYRSPAYLIDAIDLHVELDPMRTRVRARLQVRANSSGPGSQGELHLTAVSWSCCTSSSMTGSCRPTSTSWIAKV